MALVYVDRPAIHSTPYPNRPILGVVWHDTETTYPITTQQSSGGWHWLIDRDGTIYRDCSEDQAAWHVRATDRWRPEWMVPAPDAGVSDANYCTIGVELVSHADFRAAGVAYTSAQYAAVHELATDIESRYDNLWHVGHGDLQLDRTDPVQFDWNRAEFGAMTAAGRRFWGVPPLPPPPLTDDQRCILETMSALGAGCASITTWVNQVNRAAELGRELRDTPKMTTARRKAIGTELAAFV